MKDTPEKQILREEIAVAECGIDGHRRMAEQHEEAAREQPHPGFCPACGQRKPELTVKILNLMSDLKIATIEEFLDKRWTVARLMREKNVGPSTVRDIVYALLDLERRKPHDAS